MISRFLFIFLCIVAGVRAHPHIFIEPTVALLVQDNVLRGLSIQWEWDEMWSETVVDACDKNHDRQFNSAENKCVYDGYFQNLSHMHWFMQVTLNNSKLKLAKVQNFEVSLGPKQKLQYHFDFIFDIKLRNISKLFIEFEDESTYVAFDSRIWLIPPDGYQVKNPQVKISGYYGVQATIELTKSLIE